MTTPADTPRCRGDSTRPAPPIRVACRSCRARRVKCDADQGRPCWQCRSREIPCELVESKRGKYDRKGRRHRPSPPGPAQPPQADPELQSHHSQRITPPSTSYDPSSVNYTVEIVHRPKDDSIKSVRVHYPIPASIVDHSARTANFGPRTVEQTLSLQEALELPASRVSDRLISAFFEIMHAAFPVFDREEFSLAYRQGKASPMVLQTIFFLGLTVCSDQLLEEAGFSDRAVARRTHFRRAKALYDADYDRDPMNIAAVLLLLGFYWTGYDEQKDVCHWTCCATTFAQSRGFHREQLGLGPRERSMRRRIWWAIYTRDRHTAAAFGRPCRIRDEDCDLEFLIEEDFGMDTNYDKNLIPPQQQYHTLYVLHMARLAIIWGDALTAEFSPRRPRLEKYEPTTLYSTLRQWEADLPAEMCPAPLDGSLGAEFWASMLHFNSQYAQVLLSRPKSIDISTPDEVERDRRARMAADAITRNAEDQLAADTLRSCQIHLCPALFGALSIHTITICRNEPVHRQLAENKSRQCLLALSEISKIWPVKLWISKSFVSLITRMTGQSPASSDAAIVNVSAIIGPSDATNNHPDGGMVTTSDQIEASGPELEDYQPVPVQEQVFHDSFWTSWLDSALDVDLVVHADVSHT